MGKKLARNSIFWSSGSPLLNRVPIDPSRVASPRDNGVLETSVIFHARGAVRAHRRTKNLPVTRNQQLQRKKEEKEGELGRLTDVRTNRQTYRKREKCRERKWRRGRKRRERKGIRKEISRQKERWQGKKKEGERWDRQTEERRKKERGTKGEKASMTEREIEWKRGKEGARERWRGLYNAVVRVCVKRDTQQAAQRNVWPTWFLCVCGWISKGIFREREVTINYSRRGDVCSHPREICAR